jgi:hypothetical protein
MQSKQQRLDECLLTSQFVAISLLPNKLTQQTLLVEVDVVEEIHGGEQKNERTSC